MNIIKLITTTIIAATFLSCTSHILIKQEYDYKNLSRAVRHVHKITEKILYNGMQDKLQFQVDDKTRIEDIIIDKVNKEIHISLSKHFSNVPFRSENTAIIYNTFRHAFGWRYKKYRLVIKSLGVPIEELIPNIYRVTDKVDYSRKPAILQPPVAVITRPDQSNIITNGLINHNIALWHSHGWYYDNNRQQWSWQRPRLFQTVEDILPMGYTLNYLIPMLENAGANVYTPRERDLQVNEVVIDNDSDQNPGIFRESSNGNYQWSTGTDTGFAVGSPPYTSGITPFKLGTHRVIQSDTIGLAYTEWIPNIPETGYYSVQITYHSSDSSASDAEYTVYHQGGKTRFIINQQIGGNTWFYLGRFKFSQGSNPDSGKVVLSNLSKDPQKTISADAVKFGGGMGNIARNGQISRRPRYLEAARYYLQYAGIHDTLVYNQQADTLDYTDDYQSRGEWVNYLRGAPYGPNRDRSATGLKIPIDVSLAFHTDAGIKEADSTVGTLVIYSYEDSDSNLVFPDGVSRLANRDFADIVQTQLVNDIRYKYDPDWSRRALLNAGYSETYRPNVPAVIIELLSHQNFMDMQFGNDPRFKFDTGRSIYKAVLKFIATQYDREFVVQPLPITHFSATFDQDNSIILAWKPGIDPLEPTATPTGYNIYTRIGSSGFDNGIYTDQPGFKLENYQKDTIYSFKIAALNSGGESFPSEILSTCRQTTSTDPPLLIINGFDRISPARIVANSGFANYLDQGVPDCIDISYTGAQYDFNPNSPFISNTHPGYGASWSDYETRIIPGNTHDFAYVHGKAIKSVGKSFVSVSDESITDSLIQMSSYSIVDYILGEERETPWPKAYSNEKFGQQFKTFPNNMQIHIIKFLDQGGQLFISGAYVGTDLLQNKSNTNNTTFARDTLKFDLLRDQAVKTGLVFSCDTLFAPTLLEITFNTIYNRDIYTVESPDALLPVADQSTTLLRYDENHYGAATGYKGTYDLVICGFPFESIITQIDRENLMRNVIQYLEGDFTTIAAPDSMIAPLDIIAD